MKIKLNIEQYGYVYSSLLKEREDLAQYFKGTEQGRKIIIELEEDTANAIRDWAGEKTQQIGFDRDYNLTKEGKILEELADTIYTRGR